MPSSPAPDPSALPDAAHQALYRRFRAQRFGELVGQEHITTTLRHAVATDRVAHAYLFVGPRGTGKTSTARILAKAINCTSRGDDGEPCDACAACVAIREGRALDVIEIDAASHGLVEDARDLVMRALTAPTELARRIYIIDEVHMLSGHAFNALLKLVEEPPRHVVFILATTDAHKVPATIISRTQRFVFRRLPGDVIEAKLARISAAMGAEAEPAALALIARLADGAMRDAESLLDQVLSFSGDRVTVSAVRDAVGLAEDEVIADLLDAYLRADAPAALDRIVALADAGRDMAQVAAQAEDEARRRLLASAADPALAGRLAAILRRLAEAAGAGAREGRARLILELLSVEAAQPASAGVAVRAPVEAPLLAAATRQAAANAGPPSPTPPPARAPKSGSDAVAVPAGSAPATQAASEPAAFAEPRQREAAAAAPSGNGVDVAVVRGRWAEVVERATPVIKPLLRECRPVALEGARLTLAFPEGREFMRTRIAQRATQIEELLGEVLGGRFAIECVASNVELEPLSVEEAVGNPADPEAQALLEGVLKITGGELVDAPEVR
jgi:DNA polymerase-3 subunit gamma/tau